VGSVGNCIDIADAVLAVAGDGCLRGFLDDNPEARGATIAGLPVLGPLAMAREIDGVDFVFGIGSSTSYRVKQALIERLGVGNERFATIVHPSACISSSASIELGSVILANCTICANARIGRHVMMLPNCVVGHDSSIGDFTVLAASVVVSGKVAIEPNCYIGATAALREGVRIGAGALVGMGSIVVADIGSGITVAGVPARQVGQS
jgi:sugar O-acyltransferase (sialic acid O-acetyltransferase NeuD family)